MNPRAELWSFVELGVTHIWTGYDHLLFLAGLLIVCSRARTIAWIITSFTVAHSLTLGLAATNAFNLPARLVEPLIAATICYVGAENLIRREAEAKGRWIVAFVFGLIHGLGFANVLRSLGFGSRGGSGIALPLFGFNLGVELGQLSIAAIALPIIWQLRKKPQFLRRGVPTVSAIVAAMGFYWLLDRTLFQLVQ